MEDDDRRDEDHPEETLDYAPSSGSRTTHRDVHDDDVPTEHDGRATTDTTFIPDGNGTPLSRTDDDRFDTAHDRWQWLNKLQDGYPTTGDDGTEQKANSRAFNVKRDVEVVSQLVELTDYQQKRALEILATVQEQRDGGLDFGPDKPLEVTIVAAVRLACHEDGRPFGTDVSLPEMDDSSESDVSGATNDSSAYTVCTTQFIPKSVDEPHSAVKQKQEQLRSELPEKP